MATKSEKTRRELLTLAEAWDRAASNREHACVAGAEELRGSAYDLRAAVDRLFPVKPPEVEEEQKGPAVISFPVLGGGQHHVTATELAELAKTYELPDWFLLEQLNIVALKLQKGAVAKKTRRGMSRALFAWCATARNIWDRRQQQLSPEPRAVATAAPPATNGKPRLFSMGGEDVVAYHGQTYRRGQWPAEYGPWPGGAS